MSVRIVVDIPAGEVDVSRDMYGSISDSGTRHLAATIVDAANAVLRSYGLPASIRSTTARERLIEEAAPVLPLRREPQAKPLPTLETPRGGW